jgi:hypothetical protein
MTLPATQQRILNRIEDNLRASEPRLASMFGMFTRLTASELPPFREQLPLGGPRSLLSRLGSRLGARLRARLAKAFGRTRRRRTLITSSVVLLVAASAVLVGVTSGHAHCSRPAIGYRGLVLPAQGASCLPRGR